MFVILGPVALFLACGVLYWQRTPRAATQEGIEISHNLRYDVSFDRSERVRPSVHRFVNVEIRSRESCEEILFCPEIYKVVLSDLKLLHSFAVSFDNRGRSSSANERENIRSTNNSNNSQQNELCGSFSDLVCDSIDRIKTYTLIVLPRVFYRSSQANKITEALADRLLRVVGDDSSDSEHTSILCIVADEIQLLPENDYETIGRAKSDIPNLRTKHELISLFRSAIFQIPRGSVGVTEAKTQKETVAFATEPPRLEKFRALHFNSHVFARTDVLYELQKISAPVPYYASVVSDKLERNSWIEYDSSLSPTPGSLAIHFVPTMSFLTSKGWFTGKMLFQSTANSKSGDWTTHLEDFRLCGCELNDICSRFSLPTFTGEVANLTIVSGQICDGIFSGEGTVRVLEGTIPFEVIERLHSTKMLKVLPPQTMQLRFINNATPFDEFELQFSFDDNGVMFDSNYSNKIIAYYKEGSVKYGLFLPEETAGKRIPYATPLTALFDSQNESSFWNPLVRNALNHLPIPETADAGTNKQLR